MRVADAQRLAVGDVSRVAVWRHEFLRTVAGLETESGNHLCAGGGVPGPGRLSYGYEVIELTPDQPSNENALVRDFRRLAD